METTPLGPDRQAAIADLAAVDAARRTVRDRPWPVWLYPTNAVLLTAMAAGALLEDPERNGLWVVLLVAVFGANAVAGHRTGAPFALPTSRGYLAATALATVLLVAAMATGTLGGPAWLVVALAAGTGLTYTLGAVVHRRSTR